MAWWLMALQTAQAMTDGKPFDLAATAKPVTLDTRPDCTTAPSYDEIIICGQRPDQYRLPLPIERTADRARGEAQTDMGAMTPKKPCGIFTGERQCDKREAAAYGYGNGRDPVTILARLAQKVADPDGE